MWNDSLGSTFVIFTVFKSTAKPFYEYLFIYTSFGIIVYFNVSYCDIDSFYAKALLGLIHRNLV